MHSTVYDQAERLYQTFSDLIKGYQFRDRNATCICGITVSQCYTLDVLDLEGPQTMGQLSSSLYLDISTMTRVIDQLVDKQLVERRPEPEDRRVVRVAITQRGKTMVRKIRDEVIEEYVPMLEKMSASGREALIEGLEEMLKSFRSRNIKECKNRGGR